MSEDFGNGSTGFMQTSSDIPELNRGAGFGGAIIGAVIGAAAWIIVGMLGYVSGWIAVLMIYLSMHFYEKFAGGIDKTGKVVSGVIAMLMVLPASFVIYCFDVIQYIAQEEGYTVTFAQAMPVLLQDLLSPDGTIRGEFMGLAAQGYLFAFIGLVLFLVSKKSVDKAASEHMVRLARKSSNVAINYLIGFGGFAVGFIAYIVLIEANQMLIGFLLFAAGFAVLIYFSIKASSTWILMTDKGFTYNDGKKHKSAKNIAWNDVMSVAGPSEDKCCHIIMKDGTEHLMDGSRIVGFEKFWSRINAAAAGEATV